MDEEIEYSPKHLKAMQKIIEGKTVSKFGKKQIAALILAAALMLLTACTVIYREEIKDFFFEIREHGIAIFFEKEEEHNKFIEEIYEFTYVPEGFALKKSQSNLLNVDYIFADSNERTIRIRQFTLNGIHVFDTEQGEDGFIKVGDIDVYCRTVEERYNYIWVYGNYEIAINSDIELSPDELEKIINGIKTK